MKKLTEIPRNLGAAGIALALAALLIALVAIPNTASPISAEGPELPKACGPGQAPDSPDEVYDSGHLLLFDAYWDEDDKVLHNNLCPAEYEVTTSSIPPFATTETFTPSEIDVTKTIIQVNDSYKYTLTDQDDVARYPFLEDEETGVGVGSEVWWLRLGDNTATERTSRAGLGPAAGLLHRQAKRRQLGQGRKLRSALSATVSCPSVRTRTPNGCTGTSMHSNPSAERHAVREAQSGSSENAATERDLDVAGGQFGRRTHEGVLRVGLHQARRVPARGPPEGIRQWRFGHFGARHREQRGGHVHLPRGADDRPRR